jgi:FKBP12-rapamycin complex-associated protein
MTWRGRRLYPGIYREIEAGFAIGKEETVHGSLLAAGEFVSHTAAYMSDVPAYFEALCDSILKLLRHKSALVQNAVIRLIPILALKLPEGPL